TNCLNMSTRPRITFDARGWCNACQWMEEKRTLDWSARQAELDRYLDDHRSRDGFFDCIVPVSGGKDGSYVSYTLKHRYGMNPLTMTVTPALALDLGNENLRRFIDSGYDHVQINCNPIVMRKLNRLGFERQGFPYFGWLLAIQTAVIRLAARLGVGLIVYGEEGEVEYGGSSEFKDRAVIDIEFMRRVYFEGGQEDVLKASGLPEHDLNLYRFPSDAEIGPTVLRPVPFSYFEDWNPYRNYLTAKEHCGLRESELTNSGTFTNFAQNDQALYALHTYLMYLKFGFGRATQDVGIEIRRGAMTREQGLNLVRLYDGQFPSEFIDTYLEYYSMTREVFDAVLAHWANKSLFELRRGVWSPTFVVS
ncbi:MAG: N-acetyl sugar amidotransferase, partial [Ilumatobacteraceae bacterium]